MCIRRYTDIFYYHQKQHIICFILQFIQNQLCAKTVVWHFVKKVILALLSINA